MAEPSDHDLALAERAAKLAQQQQELSGGSAGRAIRFLSEAQRADRSPNAKAREDRKHADLRQIMLASAAYQAAHAAFGQRLAEAERIVSAAIEQAGRELGLARDALDDIRDHAACAPDGTRVYRDEQGRIRSEDGRILDDLDGVVIFPDGAPSYEEFIAKRDQIEALHARLQELQRIQIDVLGTARDRWEDHEFQSVEEMEAYLNQIANEVAQVSSQEVAATMDNSVQHTASYSLPIIPTA